MVDIFDVKDRVPECPGLPQAGVPVTPKRGRLSAQIEDWLHEAGAEPGELNLHPSRPFLRSRTHIAHFPAGSRWQVPVRETRSHGVLRASEPLGRCVTVELNDMMQATCQSSSRRVIRLI